jgi:ribonuclease Z
VERELVVLGTASQVPTRERAHHGALLRFDEEAVLVDPGEGTQRQLTFAGLGVTSLTRICITHAHGDHCLGLPGVLLRRSLDQARDEVAIHFPTEAAPYIDRLRFASASHGEAPLGLHPTRGGQVVAPAPGRLGVRAVPLSHVVPTVGWRFDEADGHRLVPERAARAGVHGAARAELLEVGEVVVEGRRVHRDEVAEPRRGQRVGVVMDTRWCDGALEIAERADLLLVEATFLEVDRDIAEVAGHLTAAQAARLGREAGARRVVLTHLSQRYPGTAAHLAEARAAAPDLDVVVARDLDRIRVPPRDPV